MYTCIQVKRKKDHAEIKHCRKALRISSEVPSLAFLKRSNFKQGRREFLALHHLLCCNRRLVTGELSRESRE